MKEPIISINTLAFQGYELSDMVKAVAELEIKYIEFAFIEGYTEELSETTFSSSQAKYIDNLLDIYGLKMVALAAHMDLGLKDSVEAFKRRMDFAGLLGVNIILSNASTRENRISFFRNIEKIATYAESLNMTIGLENPGDGANNLIEAGKGGAELIEEIDSSYIRLNYDVGNIYSYSKGKILPKDDIHFAYPYAVHFHFKDTKPDKFGWVFSEIGKGTINYKKVIQYMKNQPEQRPIGLEIPMTVRRDKDFNPQKKATLRDLEDIKMVIKKSYDYTLSEFRCSDPV
jgi:sugar phosphate isomerase/epimerase